MSIRHPSPEDWSLERWVARDSAERHRFTCGLAAIHCGPLGYGITRLNIQCLHRSTVRLEFRVLALRGRLQILLCLRS